MKRSNPGSMAVRALLGMVALVGFAGLPASLSAAPDIAVTSITLETRQWNGHVPTDSNDAVNTYFSLPLGSPGYASGPQTLTTFANVSNQIVFGGTFSNIAYHHHFAFTAPQAGALTIRMGADFGGGGTLLIDGNLVEFRNNDMWWNGVWTNPTQHLKGTVSITAGPHVIDSYGFEGCCDGPQQAEYSYLGDPFIIFTAPANAVPAVALSGPNGVNEGGTGSYSFTVTDADAGATFTVNSAGCGANGTMVGSLTTTGSGGSFQCSFPDGPASSTVSVQVTDNLGAQSNLATIAVNVNNVAPTVSAGFDATIDEGQTFRRHGPVSNWRAEGNAFDSADNNPGSLQNGTGFAPGINGQAFSFDGSDDLVHVADAANLRPPQLTLEAWVRPGTTGVLAGLVTKEPTPASSQLGYGFRQRPHNKFWFLISREGFGVAVAESTTTIVAGSWYHLVGTYDGSQAKLYVNGVLEGTGNGAATIDSTFPLRIGRLNSGSEPFLGQVDEVSLFNVVLPAARIATRHGLNGTAHAGQFFDRVSDTWTATVDYGDGSGVQPLALHGRAFDLEHTYADNGVYPVTVCVKDDDLAEGCDTLRVTVNNVAPTITALSNNSPIDEGSSATINVSATDPAGPADTLVLRADCNNDSTFETVPIEMVMLNLVSSAPVTCTFPDNGFFDVFVEVTDGDGGRTTGSTRVEVRNVPPRVAADQPNVAVNEGQTAANTGTYSDPATGDDVQITASTGTVTKTGTNTGTWSWSFGTTDGPAQSQTITITANDGDGGVTTTTFALTVTNVAPTATFAASSPINEGQSSTLSLTGASDPSSADMTAGLRYSFACDGLDASLASTYGAAGTASTASCTFGDNGTYAVKGRVLDKDNGQTTYQASVVVNNLAPALRLDRSGIITFPTGPAFTGRKGITQTHQAGSTDPGSDDLTFAWSAGPSSTTSAPRTYLNNGSSADPAQSPAGAFPFTASDSGSVTFAAPGIHTLAIQVRDDDGGSASASQTKLVVDDCDCTKSQGFWKHELDTKGKQKIDDATLRLYLSIVRFASGLFGPGDPLTLDTLDQARAILDPQQAPNNGGGNRPPGRGNTGRGGSNRGGNPARGQTGGFNPSSSRSRATAQALAAWLNFAKGGVLWDEMVDTNRDGRPDMRFRDLIAQVETILRNPNATKEDLDRAKNLAEAVNQHDENNPACDTETGTGSATRQATRR